MLYFYQDNLLFPKPDDFIKDKTLIPKNVSQIWITAEDGSQVEGWYIKSKILKDKSPGVIYFHGNGEVIDYCIHYEVIQNYLNLGFSVLLPEYRGYGRSQGIPSEKNIISDMRKFYSFFKNNPEINSQQIIFHGRSLGGGIAAALASKYQPSALILESTFTSVSSLSIKYLAPPFFCVNPFRTDYILPKISCPVFIAHGKSDEMIPVNHGRELHKLSKNSQYFELDGTHSLSADMNSQFWQGILLFLKSSKIIE